LEIHWNGFSDVAAAHRSTMERRLRSIVADRRDVTDLRISGDHDQHHLQGAKTARIICRARSRSVVASATAATHDLALDEALDAFERQLRKLRERRREHVRLHALERAALARSSAAQDEAEGV
jgi:ribosome-associated translation inhibitor RaiA